MAPQLELTVMAAEDLKNVATFGKMDIYALVWVDPSVKRATKVLRKGGKNPIWNEFLVLPLGTVRYCPNACLTVQIFSESSIGDKVVGIGRLALHEIYRISPGEGGDPALVSLQLERPSGRAKGIVSLSLRITGESYPMTATSSAHPAQLGNGAYKSDDEVTVMGIPVPPYSGAPYYEDGVGTVPSYQARDGPTGGDVVPYAYPPPGQYQGYPSYGMNYPNPGPYAYVQPPQPVPRSNGSLLLGLLGGAIGGLILGDIIM